MQVLSMSVDSVFVHKMWNEHELSKMVEGGVPFPMLSDGGGKVGTVYGIYDEDAGVETRGRFIIDPDGVSRRTRCSLRLLAGTSPNAPADPGLPARAREQGPEATPSGWKPGKMTLKPGPNLVGNVWEVWKTDMAFD